MPFISSPQQDVSIRRQCSSKKPNRRAKSTTFPASLRRNLHHFRPAGRRRKKREWSRGRQRLRPAAAASASEEFGCPITGAPCCGVSTPLKTGNAGVAVRCFSPIDAAINIPARVRQQRSHFLLVRFVHNERRSRRRHRACDSSAPISIRKIKPSGSVPDQQDFPLPSNASDRACRSSL